MTISLLRERLGELMDELRAIDLASKGREYNGAERARIGRMHNEVERVKEEIKLKEKTGNMQSDLSRSQRAPCRPDPNGDPNVDRGLASGKESGVMYRNLITGGTERRPGVVPDSGAYRGAGFGEFLLDVRNAAVLGSGPCQRLVESQVEHRATGLSEGVASEGGFLLEENYAGEILATVWAEPNILAQINKFSLTKGNSIKIPGWNESSRADGSRYGGIRGYWTGEGGDKTESKPDFRQIELVCKKITALIYTTDELLEDAQVLERYVQQGVTGEFQFKLTDALVRGTGAGMPLGVLASPSLVTTAIETGQASSTVVVENIVKMWSRMVASARLNATWHINQDVEPELYTMGIVVGVGGSPLFMPAGSIAGMPYSSILGRPVIPLEQCATLGTLGDLMLCSWPHYVGIDRGAMQSAVSIHVKFQYDESVFRFVYRFDGQPELGAPITPFSGSGNTLSHFGVLAARP